MIESIQGLRPLEEQFTKRTLLRIRKLQADLDSLPCREGAGRYYSKELKYALEAGLLLASLHLAASLLELYVRDLLIISTAKKTDDRKKQILDELEIYYEDSTNPKQWFFSNIVDELQNQKIISDLDAKNVKAYYQDIRIPIHHGLTRRFLRGSKSPIKKTESFDIDEMLFLGRTLRGHSLEEQLEQRGISLVKKVVVFMKKYSYNLVVCKTCFDG
jgi:hypothetical protein